MNKENLDCKCGLHWAWHFYTDDKKEIEEALENERTANKTLFYDTCKNRCKTPKELWDYVKRMDCNNTENSELNEGFIREPKTDKEWLEAELNYSDDGFEWSEFDKTELGEFDCPECLAYLKLVLEEK